MKNPRRAVDKGRRKASGLASAVMRRSATLDHAIRAYGRYTEDGGDRLAAATTYYAFLSFFPIVALAFAVTGFVVDAYPDLQESLTKQLNEYLPGLADKLDVTTIGAAKVGVGLIGLAALVLSGLAWVDALRDALRRMWRQPVEVGNYFVRRGRDIIVVVGLGAMLLASIAVTSLATSASGALLRAIGLAGSTAATVVAAGLALVLALAIDTGVFLYLFWQLPEQSDRGRVLRGAVLGAVGVEVLKIVGTLLVGKTTGNPVYGTFAVIVGLLIWINIVMRWTMFVAAWTVTAPYDSDVPPSGTAPGASDDSGASEDSGESGESGESGASVPAASVPAAAESAAAESAGEGRCGDQTGAGAGAEPPAVTAREAAAPGTSDQAGRSSPVVRQRTARSVADRLRRAFVGGRSAAGARIEPVRTGRGAGEVDDT